MSDLLQKIFHTGFYVFMSLYIFTVAITWKNAPESQYFIQGTDNTVICEVDANPSATVDWLLNFETVSENFQFPIFLLQNKKECTNKKFVSLKVRNISFFFSE